MSGPASFTQAIVPPWSPERTRAVHAGHAVVLLEDEVGRPVLLSTTASARAFLEARLMVPSANAAAPGARPGRGRVDLRAVASRARIAPAGSRFEAEWLYVETARAVMPREYRALMDRWHAWFIHVDLQDRTPRLRKVNVLVEDVPAGSGTVFLGPLRDKEAAGRYMERLTEIFDLCREERLLVQAPNATACPYKEMGRCPAPCDGSEPLDSYRTRMAKAVRFADHAIEHQVARIQEQMALAAAELHFEQAASCKRLLDRLAPLRGRAGAAYAHVGRLENARWLIAARAEREGWARLVLCLFGRIEVVADVSARAAEADLVGLAEALAARAGAEAPPRGGLSAVQREGLALMSRWLYKGERRRAVCFERLGGGIAAADLVRLIQSALRPVSTSRVEAPEMELEGSGD